MRCSKTNGLASKSGAPRARRRAKTTGRPSRYRLEISESVFDLALAGLTDQEMAEKLGIALSTLNLWKRKHPEFSESIKRGKAHADAKVARSLFELATGYSHPAVKIFNHNGKPLIVEYTQHHPPDVTACIFWLKNRDPKNWRDRREFTGADGGPVRVQSLTDAQLEAIARGG